PPSGATGGLGSDGRAIESGSFFAEGIRLGGGADVKGGFGAGDRRPEGAWRRDQADCAGTRGRSQDGQALAQAWRVATSAASTPARANRSFRQVHRAARPGGGMERDGAAARAGEPGLHWQLSAAPALSQAPSGPAQMGGAGDGAIRNRARRAGAGRLRPAPDLDWRAAGDRSSVRPDPRLFAAVVYLRLSQRKAGACSTATSVRFATLLA